MAVVEKSCAVMGCSFLLHDDNPNISVLEFNIAIDIVCAGGHWLESWAGRQRKDLVSLRASEVSRIREKQIPGMDILLNRT